MEFSERVRLLDPSPMALETGYERLPSGVLHIAIRTDMHGVTGEMFEWWFAARPGTREYRWWHPIDHVSSAWIEGEPGVIPGSIHQVVERFTDLPAQTLSIQFRSPSEYFDAVPLAMARGSGAVSALLCIRGGAGHDPHRTASGEVIGTRLIHVGRNTAWGMALRTHFFMGEDLVGRMPPEAIAGIFPDALGPNTLQHCYDEFTCLAGVLPGIWTAEGRASDTITRPW